MLDLTKLTYLQLLALDQEVRREIKVRQSEKPVRFRCPECVFEDASHVKVVGHLRKKHHYPMPDCVNDVINIYR